MSKPLVVTGAHIVDPSTGLDAIGALRAEDGLIVDCVAGSAPGLPGGVELIEAKGRHLLPGLVDMRVFTGEPGHEFRETLASAGAAAAAGGVTRFVTMPDTLPVVDDGSLVEFIARRAEQTCAVRVVVSAAITKGLAGNELSEFGLLKDAGVKLLTDGRKSIQSSVTPSMAETRSSALSSVTNPSPIKRSLSRLRFAARTAAAA